MPAVNRLCVERLDQRLLPDPRRVLARPHLAVARQLFPDGTARAPRVIERVLRLDEEIVRSLLSETLEDFAGRHRDVEQVLEHSFQLVADQLPAGAKLSQDRRLLIGAFFTLEYSIEAAALFNPSIVEAPDQSELEPGALRFVLSLRAVGEGHISSIEFRSGIIDSRGGLAIDPVTDYVRTGYRTSPFFSKRHVRDLALELGADIGICSIMMDALPDRFQIDELERVITDLEGQSQINRALAFETVRIVHLVTSSNYEVVFPSDWPMSERVIVPAGPRETQGMEDARFVRFVDDDGSVTYYGTYTAYDGFGILPQLIETADFTRFRIATLSGRFARNKGMAIFPRRIGGRYAALARHDQENLHIVFSDDVRSWNETELLLTPAQGWGILQVGNCGSPIETAEGWLVLTHGVGPFRRYVIGAALLDLEDPRRVIAELPVPLLEPDASEREGYVPNVVYSCGAMLHEGRLVLPYGFSDYGTRFAVVGVREVLDCLLNARPA